MIELLIVISIALITGFFMSIVWNLIQYKK